jgi:hypothetical protein
LDRLDSWDKWIGLVLFGLGRMTELTDEIGWICFDDGMDRRAEEVGFGLLLIGWEGEK